VALIIFIFKTIYVIISPNEQYWKYCTLRAEDWHKAFRRKSKYTQMLFLELFSMVHD
jgi:hypothetical protein